MEDWRDEGHPIGDGAGEREWKRTGVVLSEKDSHREGDV